MRLHASSLPAQLALAAAMLFLAQGARAAKAAKSPLPDGYSVSAPSAEVREGKVSATVEARAPLACAFVSGVFTDFESMPRYVPGLASSVVLSRSGPKVSIEQRGTMTYGIFTKDYVSSRVIDIELPDRIESASMGKKDEPVVKSSTTFKSAGEGCAIRYTTLIDLPSWAPEFMVANAAKSTAADQMAAMMREADRRHPAAPKAEAPAKEAAPDASSAAKEPSKSTDPQDGQPPASTQP